MNTKKIRIAVFAALALSLNLAFRGFGIMLLVLCSVAYSSTLQNKPEITWRRFSPFFHATWIFPLALTILFFVAPNSLGLSRVTSVLADTGLVHAPLDTISKAMADSDGQMQEKYQQLYFNPFWRRFYPAAQFGFLFGGVAFGAAIAMLVFNNLPVYKNVGGISSRPAFWACLAFFIIVCCLILFTEFSVLPGKFGLTGWLRPVATIVFSWIIILCSTMYAWILIENYKVVKPKVGANK